MTALPRRPATHAALTVALFAVGLALPLGAAALEPRFDHRDQQGVLLAVEYWRESVVVSGQPTAAEFAPRVSAGWSHDLSGEGNELILGASARLGSWEDQSGLRYLAGVSARYRGYFGTEELKTFFELGAWAEVMNRLAIGPEVGLGLAYDPSRAWGAFASAHFGTAFGDARIASLGLTAGVQLRFP